jgi:hypothetical protein
MLDGTAAPAVTVPAGRGKGGKRQRDEELEYFEGKR